jgi:GMP synthase-like glutamine amidotransferase
VALESAAKPQPGLIVQGQPSAPPARLRDWLGARDIPIEVHRAWSDESGTPPTPDHYRFVAVLGSAHSVTQERPEWIPQVRDLISRAIERDVPVFGICFGAQALALALGGKVAPMPVAEISWREVESDGRVVPSGPWIVWHYEAFTVPPVAVELARTELGPLAFRAGRHLGVQFHAEATPAHSERWIEEEREDLARWQVDTAALRHRGREVEEQAANAAERLFEAWWREFVEAGERPPS